MAIPAEDLAVSQVVPSTALLPVFVVRFPGSPTVASPVAPRQGLVAAPGVAVRRSRTFTLAAGTFPGFLHCSFTERHKILLLISVLFH